jgi:dTDP-4-dehydrorhamnose reductase
VIVNAAAFHKLELCELDPLRAFAVNAVGALEVARAADEVGARCVFISTDYVFDGHDPAGYPEDHPTAPISVYGVSKAAGERAVRVACPSALVIRGSGMFGHAGSSGKGGNFVETMLAKASSGEPISVVDDQVFSPTSTHDLAERILALLELGVPPGIYHGANDGSCSWHELAAEVFRLAGLAPDLRPRSTDPSEGLRPACSILLETKSEALGLPPAQPWRDALRWYMENRAVADLEPKSG